MSDSLRDALEEKFAKAAREMERRNEGLPGGWTRGVEKPSGSPIAAMASAVFRPVQAMVSTVSSVLPGRRQYATPGPAPEEEREEEEEPPEWEEPPPMEVRLAGCPSFGTVASVSDAVAVEGRNRRATRSWRPSATARCSTPWRRLDRPGPPRRPRVPDGRRRRRAGPVHDARVLYVLNTMMQVFWSSRSRRPSGRERTRDRRHASGGLRSNVPKMEEGPQLVKALNAHAQALGALPAHELLPCAAQVSPTRRSPSRTTPSRWSSSTTSWSSA